jgi:predicted transcriptional regulator
MRRSKLELYEDILSALSERALTLDDIAFECKTDVVQLKAHLAFMSKHNLIEEKCTSRKRFYGLTRRGEAIFKTLVLAKRLEKLKPTPTLNAALQALPAFTKDEQENAHRSH